MSALKQVGASAQKLANHQGQPLTTPGVRPVRRVVKKAAPKPKRRLYSIRNFVIMGGTLLFANLFLQLWMDSRITAIHSESQSTRNSILAQYEQASQLRSEIRELSSYTRVMGIATAQGLVVQENNIVFSD
ncbi:MAG: hypothetical protein FWF59_06160 [Turicibacter sp.]|nr:hypothetical protein [Turicibacter sp.]